MAKNTATITLTVENGETFINFSEAVQAKWGKRDGFRFDLGVAYFEADAKTREALVTEFGAGRIRRGLLVVSNSKEAQEMKLSKAVLALRDKVATRLSAAA